MKKTPKWLKEFKEFIAQGNVMDMAVGVVIGSAFTNIVTSIVENLLTPFIGLLIPDSTFAEWAPGGFGIGAVINSIITFLITAFVIFWIVKVFNKMKKKKTEEPPAPPEPSAEEKLLTEIRDLLKEQQTQKEQSNKNE